MRTYRSCICVISLVGFLLSGTAIPRQKQAQLSDRYKKWLTEEVVYIIAPKEIDAFTALTTDEEREYFIEQFWDRRNPKLSHTENPFKTEHYRRIAYANEHFAAGLQGWKTDRGHVYIFYGEPDEKESHPAGVPYRREIQAGGRLTSVYPYERWVYRHIDGFADNVELFFVDRAFTYEYRLDIDPEMKKALFPVLVAPQEEITGVPKRGQIIGGYLSQANFQKPKDAPFQRLARYFNVQRPPQIDFTDLKTAAADQISYNQIPFRWRADFIKLSSSKVLVPITLELDNSDLAFKNEKRLNSAMVNVYGRITTVEGLVAAEFENQIAADFTDETLEAGRLKRSVFQKSVMLSAGQAYRIDLVLKDPNSNHLGSISAGLKVPAYGGDALQASTIILAQEIASVNPTYDRLEQFVIGDMKVQPVVKRDYENGQQLIAYLQVYNAKLDQATSNLSLQISYKLRSGSNVIQTLDDPKGHSVQMASEERAVIIGVIPIVIMKPGNYDLDITILDNISGQRLTTTTDFELIK